MRFDLGPFQTDRFFLTFLLFETLIHRRLSETPIKKNPNDWLLGPRFFYICFFTLELPEAVGPKADFLF